MSTLSSHRGGVGGPSSLTIGLGPAQAHLALLCGNRRQAPHSPATRRVRAEGDGAGPARLRLPQRVSKLPGRLGPGRWSEKPGPLG